MFTSLKVNLNLILIFFFFWYVVFRESWMMSNLNRRVQLWWRVYLTMTGRSDPATNPKPNSECRVSSTSLGDGASTSSSSATWRPGSSYVVVLFRWLETQAPEKNIICTRRQSIWFPLLPFFKFNCFCFSLPFFMFVSVYQYTSSLEWWWVTDLRDEGCCVYTNQRIRCSARARRR